MNYAHTISLNGLSGLEGLSGIQKRTISMGMANVKKALKKKSSQKTQTLSFEEIFTLYNKGISTEEVQAWVWYQRTLGVPMTGWEKYFLKGNSSYRETRLKTLNQAMIRDENFRPIRTAPPGIVLGKAIKASNTTHNQETWEYFRSPEGRFMVRSNDVEKIKQTKSFGTDKELASLVKNGFLFFSGGELLPGPIFRFGNMYDRKLELERDRKSILEKYGLEVWENHLNAIEQTMPKKLSIQDSSPSERPQILAISEFAHKFKFEAFSDDSGLHIQNPITLKEGFTKWLRRQDSADIEGTSAYEIIKHHLFGVRLVDRSLTKSTRAEKKNQIKKEGERQFAKFLNTGISPEDQSKLDLAWNREFNGFAKINYEKIPVGFEASSKFKQFDLQIRPAQREAIGFMKAVGAGCLAYEVGLGKTIAAIITLADSLHSGRAERALIVVPNATYKNWIAEILGETIGRGKKRKVVAPGVLTGTSIKINEWYNLKKSIAAKINFKKAVPKKSVTVVTYEGFKKIGFSQQVIEETLPELTEMLEQSNAGVGKRSKEINYKKYREMMGVGNKGTLADIDSLGFDYLVFDEAHRCKNVFNAVRKNEFGRKNYGISGGQSELGIKAFFHTNYIQRKYGEKVMLLTATPFTNSPLEIYSMLSLVGYNRLKSQGIYNINTFFNLFVKEEMDFVVTYKDTIEDRQVIKGFNNRLVLQRLIHNFFNYKTGEDAGIKRPCKVNLPRIKVKQDDGTVSPLPPKDQILTYLEMNPLQKTIQREILYRIERASMADNFNTSAVLRGLSESKNNAFSPFFKSGIEPEDYVEFVEKSPKLFYICQCIGSVKKWHETKGEPVSGQVIYSDRGKDYFHFIQEYLIKKIGFKDRVTFEKTTLSEVEIINSSISQTKKENIRKAFNEGVVKVIIGTSTIREGINLQKKSTVLYNAYPDWNPTDFRQLEGRIWRQGNEFGYVRVVVPLIKNSADVFVFQKLEEKTARINDIWYRSDRGNVLDLESLDPEEIKLALISDNSIIAAHKVKKKKAEVERKVNRLSSNLRAIENVGGAINNARFAKDKLLRSLTRLSLTLENLDHVHWTFTAKELVEKGYSDARAMEMKQERDAFHWARVVQNNHSATDKEVLRAGNFAGRVRQFEGRPELNIFREARAEVSKAEKTILTPRGYTAQDDLEKVKDELRDDLKKARQELIRVGSPAFLNEMIREVIKAKSALNVDAKTVAERVRDFEKLNYLMAFKAGSQSANACNLPDPNNKPPDNSQKLLLIRIRAKALRLQQLQHKAA